MVLFARAEDAYKAIEVSKHTLALSFVRGRTNLLLPQVYNGYSCKISFERLAQLSNLCVFAGQTRTLDVRPDTSDPTGAIAIAEANRQTAMQQQGQNYQQPPILQYPLPPRQEIGRAHV